MEVDPNPIHIPVPPEQSAKEYKVTGETTVLDHAPGETFTALLDPQQEEELVTYGHLEVLSAVEQEVEEEKVEEVTESEEVEVPVEEEQDESDVEEEKE